jgi:hypothetical protein
MKVEICREQVRVVRGRRRRSEDRRLAKLLHYYNTLHYIALHYTTLQYNTIQSSNAGRMKVEIGGEQVHIVHDERRRREDRPKHHHI